MYIYFSKLIGRKSLRIRKRNKNKYLKNYFKLFVDQKRYVTLYLYQMVVLHHLSRLGIIDAVICFRILFEIIYLSPLQDKQYFMRVIFACRLKW